MRGAGQDRWLKSHENHDLDSWVGHGRRRSRKNYSTEDRCTDIKVREQLRKLVKDHGRHEKEGEKT